VILDSATTTIFFDETPVMGSVEGGIKSSGLGLSTWQSL
jgi:hypothetical protein